MTRDRFDMLRADGVPGLDTGWAVLDGDRVVAADLLRTDALRIVRNVDDLRQVIADLRAAYALLEAGSPGAAVGVIRRALVALEAAS